ncbi:hypothetical protein D3C73_1193180 [compost metagenome]
MIEDGGFQHVAAYDGKRRGGDVGFGLFNNVRDALGARVQMGFAGTGGHYAVLAGVGAGHVLHAQHTGVLRNGNIHQLLHGGRVGVDQVIGQQHGKGLVAHGGGGRQHGVAQAQRGGLANVEAIHMRG